MFEKFLEFIKKNKIIISILVGGFLYRIYGIYFDYPLGVNAIWDETYSMSYLLDLLQYRSFSLAMDPYPILLPLLYFPVLVLRILYLMLVNHLTSIDSLSNFLTVNGAGYIHIISRWYSVFFGVATIFLAYKIPKLVFGSRASGYFAAVAYAVSLVPVAMAHWGKAHIPMIFFLILSLFFVLKYEESKENKFLYLCVLASALSFSTHYLGISSFIFPFMALVLNRKQINIKILVKSFLIVFATVVIFFVPNLRGISNMFLRDVGRIRDNSFLGMFPSGNLERFYYIWHDTFLVEPIFISLLVIVLVISGKKLWKNIGARYILFGLVFNYVLMATVFAAPFFIRWQLTFITLSIILSAGYFASCLSRTRLKPQFVSLVLIVLLLPGAYFSYKWDRLLNGYTRNEVAGWLKDNLKSDEYAYSFDLYIDVPLSYEAAKWQKENNHITSSKKINYIISHKEDYLNRGVNLFYDLGFERYDELGGKKTKYVVIYYWEAGNIDNRYDLFTQKSAYKIIDNVKKFHSLTLEKAFYPSNNKKIIENGVEDYLNNPLHLIPLLYLERSGPIVEIYKINS